MWPLQQTHTLTTRKQVTAILNTVQTWWKDENTSTVWLILLPSFHVTTFQSRHVLINWRNSISVNSASSARLVQRGVETWCLPSLAMPLHENLIQHCVSWVTGASVLSCTAQNTWMNLLIWRSSNSGRVSKKDQTCVRVCGRVYVNPSGKELCISTSSILVNAAKDLLQSLPFRMEIPPSAQQTWGDMAPPNCLHQLETD